MNLFALTNNPAARILRFPLSGDLQKDVKSVFRSQRQAFLEGITDTIEFDGRYRPDEGELLVINNFVDPDMLVEVIKNPIGVEQYDPNDHSLDTVKAIRDYLTDYKTAAKDKEIAAIVSLLGLDKAKLIALINTHVTEANLNEFGRFDVSVRQ